MSNDHITTARRTIAGLKLPEEATAKLAAIVDSFEALLLRSIARPRPTSALRDLGELAPGAWVAVYIRVSRLDQDPTLQHNEIEKYCSARGFRIFKIYVDYERGGRDKRPDLLELMGDARKLLFKAVVVWKVDRFGRNTLHMLTTWHELENVLGIRFVSVTEPVDTSTAMGELMRGFLALIARFEARQNAERTSAGMEARRRAGVRLGRPKQALTFEQLAEVQRLRWDGWSTRRISRELGIERTRIQRALAEIAIELAAAVAAVRAEAGEGDLPRE